LRKQIEEVRRQLKGVEKLSKEYNITAGVHIHSGMFITAEPTVLWLILDGFDPNLVGAYIDPGHMCVEGGLAGWLMGLDILADKIRIVAIKDYGWFKVKGQWAARTVPIGQGLVQWKEVFRILKQINFSGPLSVHSEYDAPLNKIIKLTKKDISRLRELV
jgi:sugar phosphate isomerase/epimerase